MASRWLGAVGCAAAALLVCLALPLCAAEDAEKAPLRFIIISTPNSGANYLRDTLSKPPRVTVSGDASSNPCYAKEFHTNASTPGDKDGDGKNATGQGGGPAKSANRLNNRFNDLKKVLEVIYGLQDVKSVVTDASNLKRFASNCLKEGQWNNGTDPNLQEKQLQQRTLGTMLFSRGPPEWENVKSLVPWFKEHDVRVVLYEKVNTLAKLVARSPMAPKRPGKNEPGHTGRKKVLLPQALIHFSKTYQPPFMEVHAKLAEAGVSAVHVSHEDALTAPTLAALMKFIGVEEVEEKGPHQLAGSEPKWELNLKSDAARYHQQPPVQALANAAEIRALITNGTAAAFKVCMLRDNCPVQPMHCTPAATALLPEGHCHTDDEMKAAAAQAAAAPEEKTGSGGGNTTEGAERAAKIGQQAMKQMKQKMRQQIMAEIKQRQARRRAKTALPNAGKGGKDGLPGGGGGGGGGSGNGGKGGPHRPSPRNPPGKEPVENKPSDEANKPNGEPKGPKSALAARIAGKINSMRSKQQQADKQGKQEDTARTPPPETKDADKPSDEAKQDDKADGADKPEKGKPRDDDKPSAGNEDKKAD